RHNDVIHGLDNHFSMFLKQQSGGKERTAHAFCSTHSTQRTQIGMHQRFPTREDNPLHLQFAKTGEVKLEISLRNFSCLPNSPDIAHHGTTIAGAVRKNNQDGKLCDPMLCAGTNRNGWHSRTICRLTHTETTLPASRVPPDKQVRVSLSSWRTEALT